MIEHVFWTLFAGKQGFTDAKTDASVALKTTETAGADTAETGGQQDKNGKLKRKSLKHFLILIIVDVLLDLIPGVDFITIPILSKLKSFVLIVFSKNCYVHSKLLKK